MTSVDSYIKHKRLETYQSLIGAKRIYLDTNYWIRFREASRSSEGNDVDLLHAARELVKARKCIFPISETTFWEMLKQRDWDSLKKSGSVIDQLSNGISLVTEEDRRRLEILYFLRMSQGKEVHPCVELVWTTLSMNVLYMLLPQPEDEHLKRSFIDFLHTVTFLDMIDILKNNYGHTPLSFKDNVDMLNASKEKYQHENATFPDLFLSELAGYMDLFKDSMNEAMEGVYVSDTGREVTNQERASQNPDSLRNAIYNLFRLKKVTTEFPTFSILPELSANVRWNKTRKYRDGNDTIDFLHATAALPYFDYFFTERELKTIITQRQLDTRFECIVESDPAKLTALLNSL